MKTVKFELVTKSNEAEYSKIHDGSIHDSETLALLHEGWYDPYNCDNSWNKEIYLVKRDGVICGYFSFTKYHQDLRVGANSVYLLPEARGAELFGEILLFVGNRVFIELGYNKIEATAHSLNEAVVKLYDRFMDREGELKNHYSYNRKFHSSISWGICYDESPWKDGEKITLSGMLNGAEEDVEEDVEEVEETQEQADSHSGYEFSQEEEVKEGIFTIDGIDYSQIDAPMRVIVKLLNDNGYKTMGSCQGGEGHMFDLPMIVFDFGEGDKDEIVEFLLESGCQGFTTTFKEEHQRQLKPFRKYIHVEFWSLNSLSKE